MGRPGYKKIVMMNRTVLILAAALIQLASGPMVLGMDTFESPARKRHAHRQEKLLLSGSMNTAIMIIDRNTGEIEWQHAVLPYEDGWECNSVEEADGNILFSYKKGARLINKDHETLWDYPAPDGCEIHHASVLPDGGFLIAINGVPTRIVELDKEGKTRKEIRVKEDLGNDNPHMQCRQIGKASNGNYLVPVLGRPALYEIDAEGNTVRTYSIRGGAFSVVETKDGNLLLPLGDTHGVQMIDRETGGEIFFFGQDDLPGCRILFAAEIDELDNGHFMLTNWSGHQSGGDSPQLIEFDASGKVYWTLNDERYGTLSSHCIWLP